MSIKWLLAALAIYLLALIYTLPAAQVLGRMQLPEDLALRDVSGTIWSGKAQQLVYQGATVERVHWELSFAALLKGQLRLDLDAGNKRQKDEIAFQGSAALSLLQKNRLYADDLTVFLPSPLVIAQLPLPVPVNADGRFKLSIEQLVFQGKCETLTGQGQWLNADLMGLGEPLKLGSFDAELSCLEGDTLIRVKEPNSFGLSADARVSADMQFSVQGKFKPAANLPKQVHDAAQFFGRPDAQGYYQFDL